MEQDFWHRRWAKNEIAFHQPEPNALLRRFWAQVHAKANAPVFVPLCGKSPDLVWLAERDHPVIGVELSAIAIADFFAECGLEPGRAHDGRHEQWTADPYRLLQGDFFDLHADDLIDVGAVYDRAALIAFPPEMRQRYADYLLSVTPRTAPICLLTLEYTQSEMSGPPFSVDENEVKGLFSAVRDIELLLSQDALVRSQRFRDKGLSWMQEKIYVLRASGEGVGSEAADK